MGGVSFPWKSRSSDSLTHIPQIEQVISRSLSCAGSVTCHPRLLLGREFLQPTPPLLDTMAAHTVLFEREIGSSFGSITDRVLVEELVRAFLGSDLLTSPESA